jgi:DNA-binding transcriptional LysR family regulator
MRIRMDWRLVRFDWNRARAFLVTAEEGSLSAASRALGMAQPTLGRQVGALEAELGVTLFERVGRRLVLTTAGASLLEHVRAMGEAAGRVSLVAAGTALSVEGTVSITASEIYAAFLLPPAIARLRREAPGLVVEIVASNATIDLRRREADIAVRSFRPREPDLVARKLFEDPARLYASPAYLARLGEPRSPGDLAEAEFVGFDTTDRMLDGLNALGLRLARRNFPIVTASHVVHLELARSGVAIGVFPDSVAAKDPALVPVLPDLPPLVIPVWLTSHRELATSRRIRLVFDLLAEELTGPGRMKSEPGM